MTSNKQLDDVQQIDSSVYNFLVENPDCESLEVKQGFEDGTKYGYNFIDWKVILP